MAAPLQRQAGFQEGQRLVDTAEHVLHAAPLGPALPRHRDRHDHADDRARYGPDGQVVRGPPGALGHRLTHHRDRPGELVHRPRPDLGHGHGEPGRLPDDIQVGAGVGGEHLPGGRAYRGDRAQPGRLLLERRDHPGVHVVLQDQVFLGREVPEERARRHLGRRGDLLHGGGLVALFPEQPERVLPQGSTRPGLLPLAQAGHAWHGGALACVEHVRHTSNCARSAPFSPGAAASGAAGAPSARRGRKTNARMALATAMPPHAHSMVSMPWTNAVRAECSRAADPIACATPTPATTLLLAAAAAAAGRPWTARCPRYTVPSTVPSTATPMVAPTWRSAEINAEPEPLRSADSADNAAFMVCGMASPTPSPNAASHAAANPVPLPALVVAPNASATVMIANPAVTSPFTLASGPRSSPAPRRGVARRVPPIIPTTSPPIIGSSRSPLPIAFAPCTSWKYCGMA